MGVYMQPVYDELIKAWNEGVLTYDRATKKNIRMYVWYQYSMHDFLAYGIFAGWCVHGKFPCPVCKAALEFKWSGHKVLDQSRVAQDHAILVDEP
jgi:hypothetical protein